MSLFSRKKTVAQTGFFNGLTDCHSHILPGVDDGIRSMKQSVAALSFYETLGVQSVWCTPHIMEDIPNTPAFLRERFEELKNAYSGPITLHLAAEHMMDNLFVERLAAGDVLPHGDAQDSLLVETSYFSPPLNMDSILDDIMSKGYFPLLAHPERYEYMGTREFEKLHSRGIKFQMNIFSLAGIYGKGVKAKAEWLYKRGMYSCYGSDIHSLTAFKAHMDEKVGIKFQGV